jgi:carboxyl-terminal processing protease
MKLNFFILTLLLFTSVTFCAPSAKSKQESKKDLEASSQNLNIKDLELFNKVLYILETQYYKKVDSSQLIQAAIKGMVSSLDPHTAYLDPEMYQKMENDTNGEFIGIGVEVTTQNNMAVIVSVMDDTPAEKSGIQSGDRIIEINGKSVIGHHLDSIVDKMKGRVGESIKLVVLREGKQGQLTFVVKREVNKVSSVKSKLLRGEFAYIRITQFQKQTSDLLDKALAGLKNQLPKNANFKGIILDLRSNPGGLLEQAVEVSSRFISSGVIVSTQDRDGKIIDKKEASLSCTKYVDTPMAVLINGSSASASEIVAGALQDYSRAIIMGSQSFGKGSVQSLIEINKGAIKVTIAQYLTPKGRRIQAEGIVPDMSSDAYAIKSTEEIKQKGIREKDLSNHLKGDNEDAQDSKLEEKMASGTAENEDLQIKMALDTLNGLHILKK